MTIENLNVNVATMEDLDNLNLDQILGVDVSEVSLSSNLPDGTYFFRVANYDVKKFPAKPEEQKKARMVLNLQLDVIGVKHLSDATLDPESFIGRKHFEGYDVLSEMGLGMLTKLMLGAMGVSFTDKNAIREVGRGLGELLEGLKSEGLAFGATVKTTERNGYENCNIVLKNNAFIDVEKTMEELM